MALTQLRQQMIANRNYNRERQDVSDWIKRDLDKEKLLKEVHKQAAKRVQGRIDDFYMRYATREGLTRQEAMKRADQFDVTKYFNRARVAVKEKDFSKETNEMLRLYNLKMETSRLEVLKAEINLDLLEMYDADKKIIEQGMRDEINAEIKRQEAIIKDNLEQAGIHRNSVVRPFLDYQSIINADFYGASFSERIWGRTGHYAEMQKELFASLNNIYTDMDGYRRERNRLMKKFDTTEYEAMRLLKTETARVGAETQTRTLKANGFTHYIYVAEGDACDVCADLDGMAIPIEDLQVGYNQRPMHPNCRCSGYGQIKMEYVDGGSNIDEYAEYIY